MTQPLLQSSAEEVSSYASLELRENRSDDVSVKGSSQRTTITTNGLETSQNIIIDGQVTNCFEENQEFENVGSSVGLNWDDPSTTRALDLCKKYILYPYNVLLIIIGWRRLRSNYDYPPVYKKGYNYLYPPFILLMLAFACACQIATCFFRVSSTPPIKAGEYKVLKCGNHLFTKDIISYIMILSSFVFGFYIFRWAEPENISSLTETVFLSFNNIGIQKSRRRPVFILLSFLISGVVWFVASAVISILRLDALELTNSNTVIEWFVKNYTEGEQEIELKLRKMDYEVTHYTLTISALLGFVFFDLLYIAVVLNYCSQCQLLIYYVTNIIDKVQNKRFTTLLEASKEIHRVFEFLKLMNGWLSYITTLGIFIFLGNLILSYESLTTSDHQLPAKNIVVGFLNVVQWLTATAFPVIMAVRFTMVGKRLKRLGLEISQRPYIYSGVSEIELQFFLDFMNSTNFTAKLSFVPMYPSLVIGFTFIILLLITVGVGIPQVNSVWWF